MKEMKNIVSVVLIVIAAGCKQNNQPKEVAKPMADSTAVFLLQTGSLDKTISLPGELIANEKVQVFGKVNGYIKKILVDIGSPVKKGQVIAVLEAPEMQSKIAESKQRLESAKAKLVTSNDIYKRLLEASKTDGVIAPADLEKAKNQVRADEASIQAAQSAVNAETETASYLTLLAPFTGIVTKRSVDVGAYVGKPGETPLFEIEDNATLRLRIAVPEVLTGTKVKDEKVQFTLKALPGKKFDGKLSRKSSSLDPSSRSEIWEFAVINVDRLLKSGMFADCKLNIQRETKSFFVPYSAVVTTLEKKFVIRSENNIAKWIDVSQGVGLPDKTEIFGNLKEGDTLVLKGNEELKTDTKLVLKNTKL